MTTEKSLQLIDKSNMMELKEELYNRKRILVNLKIHGTLKQDLELTKKAKVLKKECRTLTQFISVIIKTQQETLLMKKVDENLHQQKITKANKRKNNDTKE